MLFKVLIPLIQKYLLSSYFFGRQVVCVLTAIFFNKPFSKKCRNYTFYVWWAVWCLSNGCTVQVAQHRREIIYCKRAILCLSSSKILIPHHPLRLASVSSPPNKGGGYTLAGRRGGWGVNILEDER